MTSRIMFHPLLQNKRSRFIFLVLMALGLCLGIGFWIQVNYTLHTAGLQISMYPINENGLIRFLLSASFRGGLIFAVILLASAMTARHVVGPIKRIEQWLQDWHDNLNPLTLFVRKGDKYQYLVQLLNELYQKLNRPS